MLGKIQFRKYLLINFAKGTNMTSFRFVILVGMLLGAVLLLMLTISSSLVGVMENVSLLGFRS